MRHDGNRHISPSNRRFLQATEIARIGKLGGNAKKARNLASRNKDPLMADDHHLPPEIIYEILSRLPVKSLARFQSVCKLWFKFINDPYLQTIHVKQEPIPIIFQQLSCVSPGIMVKYKQCRISFLRVIQGTTSLQKDPVLRFLCKLNPLFLQEKMVLGSCNGLTLVCYKKNPTFLAIINPLSKQRYNLPPIKIRSAHGNCSEWWSYNEGTKVVWFDLKTEEFGLTNPPKREQGYWANDKLVDLNSEVGLAYNDNDHVELWALKQQEWVLHCRLDLRPKSYNNRVAISGCWSKNGDILLTSDKGRKLFVYTLKTGVLRRVKWRDRFEADVQMYQTSLVSIHAMSAYLGEKVSMRRRRKRKV
ncbi:hypothetical protein E3N88_01549 [Mikania micrantha]|uniref:F-box domain-containing protein n=1 Tax=Mikania micrantha TaxID=192012 RepID=A0A5N6Q1W4_9ASTR|nr:hypothetical protein E3N88_01549 [Mikania micrantha]